ELSWRSTVNERFFPDTKEAMNVYDIQTHYDPDRLLDTLLQRLDLSSDDALSRKLKVDVSIISNIRSRKFPVSGSLLLWMHEASGMDIDELRCLLGDKRTKSRLSCALTTAKEKHRHADIRPIADASTRITPTTSNDPLNDVQAIF
ncbi:MAG TPA: hypothetical protein VF427_15080, partial [Noviherbaspirillum sp.]